MESLDSAQDGLSRKDIPPRSTWDPGRCIQGERLRRQMRATYSRMTDSRKGIPPQGTWEPGGCIQGERLRRQVRGNLVRTTPQTARGLRQDERPAAGRAAFVCSSQGRRRLDLDLPGYREGP
jgi:hypothetical protein